MTTPDDDFVEMTPDELREILAQLLWSQRQLAYRAWRGQSNTHKMARGREAIDRPLAEWLRALHRLVTNPPRKPRIQTNEPDHPPQEATVAGD